MYWRRILRNIFANWLGYVVSIAIGFSITPLLVHKLGNTGYGVWTLVLSLTGYFGVLDLGIRSSVGRFVARYVALNDEHNVNRTVSTAFAMLAGAGILAWIATLVIHFMVGTSFKVDSGFESAARTALLIVGLNIGLALPMGVFSAVVISLERFDVLTAVTVMGAVARAILIVKALASGYGVVALALITLVVGMAEYCAMAACAKGLYRRLKLRLRFVDRGAFKDLCSFSVYRFVWIIANQLIFYTDSVVIGIFLGAGAITHYAIAVSVINYGRHVVSLVTDTFAPSATRLHALHDLAGLQRLLLVGTKVALLVALPLCAGFIFLGEQFITIWLGKDYASSAIFLIVLTIPQVTSLAQYVSALILAGMAKHKVLAYLALAEGLANLVLSVILIKKMGLIGVAWGTAIPGLISTAFVVPWYTLRILKLTFREYWLQSYLRPLLCTVPAAGVAYAFHRVVEKPTWLIFGGEVMVICGVFACMAYFVCFEADQRSVALGKIRAVFQRRVLANEA